MSTVAAETSPSSSDPVISLENLLFDFPEADVILRSCDSYEFRVLKLYIVHCSQILGEKLLLSINPQPGPNASTIPAKSKAEVTVENALCVVQLPVEGVILFSLLTYIFPVPPVLPSTEEQAMKLLSVAQMYKMNVVLTHIRNDIARQEPPFIREDTAYLIYSLAQKHGLRTEALEAARCTLSFSSMTIEDLAKEKKLDMMPGVFLYELWKYHQRVRLNLTSDIEEFRQSNALKILGDLSCNAPSPFVTRPYWLHSYISDIGRIRVPAFLDFTDFQVGLTKHITKSDLNRNTKGGCASCSSITRKNMRKFWDALTATVYRCIAKVSVIYVVVSSKGPERFYRPR